MGVTIAAALVSAPGCGSDDDDDSGSSTVSSEDLKCGSGIAAGGLCDSELVQSLSAGTVGALSIEDLLALLPAPRQHTLWMNMCIGTE